MQALPVVLIGGDLGAGKTRLLAGLAERWLPQGPVGALLWAAGPIHLDPLWLPGDVIVALQDEQLTFGGGGHCDCGEDDCEGEPALDDLGLLQTRHGVTRALVELGAHQDGRGLRDLLRARPDRRVVTVAVVGSDAEARSAALEEWLVEADVVALADESCLASLPARLRQDAPVKTIAEWLAAPAELLALGRGGVPAKGAGHPAAGATPPGDPCGCGDPHHHHHGAPAGDPEALPGRRADPVWMPFWLEEGIAPAALARAVKALPAGARRIKAVTVDAEGEIGLVDRQDGVVTRRTRSPAEVPLVHEPGAMGEDEESPPVPFEEGTLVLAWVPDPQRTGQLEVELALHRGLATLEPKTEGEESAELAATLLEEDAGVEAIACARAAVAGQPENPAHLELLAKGYHQLGENGRALALLAEAHRVGPGYASAWLNAARLHLAYAEVEEAVATGEQGLALDPEDPDALAVVGEALAHAGREAEGTAHLEAASKAQPEDDAVRRLLIQLHLGADRTEAALRHAEALVALAPEDDSGHFLVGELRLQLGLDAAALEALSQARALGNETPWVLADLAIASHRTGDGHRAAEVAGDAFALAQEAWEEAPDADGAVDLLLTEVLCGDAVDVKGRAAALAEEAPEAFTRLVRLLGLAEGLGAATVAHRICVSLLPAPGAEA